MAKYKKITAFLKKHKAAVSLLLTAVIIALVWFSYLPAVQVSARIKEGDHVKLYFDIGNGINEEDSVTQFDQDGWKLFKSNPDFYKASVVRIDVEDLSGQQVLSDIVFYSGSFAKDDYIIGTLSAQDLAEASQTNDVTNVSAGEDGLHFEITGADPYFVLSERGAAKDREIVRNCWYFKLAVSAILLTAGILVWSSLLFTDGDEKKRRWKRLVDALAVSILIQFFFGWYVIRSAEDVIVYDSKDAQTCQLAEDAEEFVLHKLPNGLKTLNVQIAEIDAENEAAFAAKILKFTVLSESGDVLAQTSIDKTELAEADYLKLPLKKRYNGDLCRIRVTDEKDAGVGVIGLSVKISGITIDRALWLIVYSLLCNLVILCAVLYEVCTASVQKALLLGMYGLTFAMNVFEIWFYKTFVHGFADESYHVGYVAYLQKTGKLIPVFSDMRALAINGSSAYFAQLPRYNYLGHPPLYYHMLRLAGAFRFDGDMITLDLNRLRTFSNVLAFIGIALVLYIGYTRIRKDRPYFHLFYVTTVMGIPMMTYGMAGINNDVLSLLGCGLFFLGALRFTEEKKNYGTFLLMAVGMCFSLLSKLTAGCVLVLLTVMFVGWYCLVRKGYREIFCKPFLVTLPIYAVTLFYFVMIYLQTGKLQPRIKDMAAGGEYKPKFYVEFMDRQDWSAGKYLIRFLEKFSGQWTGIVSHASLHHMGSEDSVGFLLRMSLWILPALLFAGFLTRKETKDGKGILAISSREGLLRCAYLAIITTAVVQMFRGMKNFFYKTGYMGSYQSRYYLCVAMILSFSIVHVLGKWDKQIGKKLNWLIVAVAAYFLFSDFIYFLLEYTSLWVMV